MNTYKKLPGVMSIRRTLVMSDAMMYNIFPETDDAKELRELPVEVMRHGIRGMQNLVSGKETSVNNIQETDTAKLAALAIGMRVDFHIRFMDLRNSLASCAPGKGESIEQINAIKDSYFGFIERASKSEGLEEVGRRYARNIANGRWLWGNRMLTSDIEITVDVNGETLSFRADDISLRDFNDYSDNERKLGRYIARSLAGDGEYLLNVSARLNFGFGSVEVFPSQNYLADKPKGFARSLYKHGKSSFGRRDNTDINVVGYAAIRDQKVMNAIRTIDTWYQDYPVRGIPIAIEPNGANLDAQDFFRRGANKGSAFDLMLRLNAIDPASDEGMFVIASMIRGGVYSGGSDDDKSSKAE